MPIRKKSKDITISGNDVVVTKDGGKTFTKSTGNSILQEFETMVEQIRKDVKNAVDYRKSIKDDDPATIKHYTDNVIKSILRASRWA